MMMGDLNTKLGDRDETLDLEQMIDKKGASEITSALLNSVEPEH
jgi:hypothetical protein